MNPIYPKDQQKKVAQAISLLEKNCQEIITRMTNIEKQGMTHASPWWRDEKYLYLIHSMKDGHGQRKREYIGCDDTRIKEALARVERYKQHQRLQEEGEILRARVGQVKAILKELYKSLRL